jgi:DNA-directed RNA polymerase subunit RPC12/RpoP
MIQVKGAKMRIIPFVSFIAILCIIAATGHAQIRPFGVPNIPQPHIPQPPNLPQPGVPHFQPPQAPVFVKRCMRCGHEVPASSSDGMMCPYCGVVWGAAGGISNNNTGTGPVTQTTVVKHCSHCGKKVPETSEDGQVCPHCGVTWGKENKLNVRTTTITRTGASGNAPPDSATPSTTIAVGLPIGNDTIQFFAHALEWIGGALVVVGIGVGIWKWNQTRKPQSAARPAPGGKSVSRQKNLELPEVFEPLPQPATSPKDQWMYFMNGQQYGPVSSREMRQLAADGKLAPTDRVWREGLAEWIPAAKLKGLFPIDGVRS